MSHFGGVSVLLVFRILLELPSRECRLDKREVEAERSHLVLLRSDRLSPLDNNAVDVGASVDPERVSSNCASSRLRLN